GRIGERKKGECLRGLARKNAAVSWRAAGGDAVKAGVGAAVAGQQSVEDAPKKRREGDGGAVSAGAQNPPARTGRGGVVRRAASRAGDCRAAGGPAAAQSGHL